MTQNSARPARDEWVPIELPEDWRGPGVVPGTGRSFEAQQGEELIVTLALKVSRPKWREPERRENHVITPFKCVLKVRVNDRELDSSDSRAELFRWGLVAHFDQTDYGEGQPDPKPFRYVWRVELNPDEKWSIWLHTTRASEQIVPDKDVGYWLTRLGPHYSIPSESEPLVDSDLY